MSEFTAFGLIGTPDDDDGRGHRLLRHCVADPPERHGADDFLRHAPHPFEHALGTTEGHRHPVDISLVGLRQLLAQVEARVVNEGRHQQGKATSVASRAPSLRIEILTLNGAFIDAAREMPPLGCQSIPTTSAERAVRSWSTKKLSRSANRSDSSSTGRR